MDKKKQLGQFFTTNYKYIMKDLFIPDDVKYIVEPFAGNKDMLKNFNLVDCDTGSKCDSKKYDIKLYDIDPAHRDIIKQDTLLNIPNYENSFIITNPPYLARNKCRDKSIYTRYNQNDLYKCFIMSFININLLGGIIIIPLNFWCSIRRNDINLRKLFLQKFRIVQLNIFEEKVFEDTSYSVCCFQFKKKSEDDGENANIIKTRIFPKALSREFKLDHTNNYTIGGEIYQLNQSKEIKVERLTRKNKKKYVDFITNIKVYALDSNSSNKIRLELTSEENRFIDRTKNSSERTFATLIITPKLTIEEQKIVVNKFNNFIEINRKKYNSLFLSNYRESSDIARKRISFSLVYKIVNYLISTYLS
jgi:hypothetical protein